jgi:hypothetical protein
VIRADKSVQRYLSIGRVMANVRELQSLMPEAADLAAAGDSMEATNESAA